MSAQHAVRPERGLFIEHEIDVCTYDIDFASHVSNIAYLRWLEDMRFILFEKYFPLKLFLDQGTSPIISSTYIQYKRPIKLFDRPRGLMWISDMGKASLNIEAEIYVGETLTTTAKHIGVFIDLKSGRPIRIPKLLLDAFETATEPLPPLVWR